MQRGCVESWFKGAAALLVDPMGFDAGDSNLYRYVNNPPTNATDPSGNEIFTRNGDVAKGLAAEYGKKIGINITASELGDNWWVLIVSPDDKQKIKQYKDMEPQGFFSSLFAEALGNKDVNSEIVEKKGSFSIFALANPPKIPDLGGADITEALTRGLNNLDAKYKSLNVQQKEAIAESLYFVDKGAGWSWDINNLIGSNPRTTGITKAGERANTATVMGKVYYTPQINYILWGRINKLLSDDGIQINSGNRLAKTVGLELAIGRVKAYRGAKQYIDGYGVEGPADWAKIGWNWNGKFVEVPASNLNLRANPRKYNGVLTFQVGRSLLSGVFSGDKQTQAILEVNSEPK